MSDLVGNPEDRFSRVEAHFSECSIMTLQNLSLGFLIWSDIGMD